VSIPHPISHFLYKFGKGNYILNLENNYEILKINVPISINTFDFYTNKNFILEKKQRLFKIKLIKTTKIIVQ
jgi:hypothetical protein